MNIPRTSATDRAWASYDIAAEILETLYPGPPGPLHAPSIYPYNHWAWVDHRRRNRDALAKMARVCRALSGVALDVLWRYIDNIFHLVDVVPSCYTAIESVWNAPRVYEEIKFTRDPDERELLSLQTYAARIRELKPKRSGFQYVCFVALLRWLPTDVPILPQLRRLDWRFDQEYYRMPLSTMTKLLDFGNLRHLSLFIDDSKHRYPENMLNDIYLISTKLQSLSLHADDYPLGAPSRACLVDDNCLIWRIPNLKSLKLDVRFTLTRPILVLLSELPLQSLTLSSFSTSISTHSPRLHFPALLNLSLATRVSRVVDIMQSISFPNATAICLSLDDEGPIPEHHTAFHTIYSAFPASLRRLHIEVTFGMMELNDAAAWLGPGALNFDTFVWPLQSLRDLRELKLNVWLGEHIDGFLELRNSDLRSLILPAWPRLSFFEYTIQLMSLPMPPLERDDPTLDTVFAFARAHPHLLHLSLTRIRMDPLPDYPPPLEDAARPLEGHGLMWLKLGESANAPSDLKPIARVIDRAFPRVSKELRRAHALYKRLKWSFLERELCALHRERFEDAA